MRYPSQRPRGAFVVGLVTCALGCPRHGGVTLAPATPPSEAAPAAAATSSTATAGGAAAAAARLSYPENAALGRFRIRARLPVGVLCATGPWSISELAPVSHDEAWLVGTCALRGRLTGTGFIDLRAPERKIHKQLDPPKWECAAQASFNTVAARSEHEVYVAGTTRCAIDPNGIWQLVVVRLGAFPPG